MSRSCVLLESGVVVLVVLPGLLWWAVWIVESLLPQILKIWTGKDGALPIETPLFTTSLVQEHQPT